MLLRVLGSFILLLVIAGLTGCEQAPTEVNAPEFSRSNPSDIGLQVQLLSASNGATIERYDALCALRDGNGDLVRGLPCMFVLTRSGNLNTVGRISSNEPIPNGTGRSVVYGSRTDPNLRCGMLDAEGNEVYTSKFQVVVSASGQVSAHCVFNG